jgi:D-glycero-D-manno-heptose 1,7-bisphosphate phosphatase
VAKSAIFLDCNGVLNTKAGYLHKIEDLRLLPEVATAIRKLNDLNLFCCLVYNQSGLAQNYYPRSHVDALHERLCQLLYSQAKAKLDALYYCPYLSPTAGGTNPKFTGWSTWRKPNTGMLVAAAWEYNLNLQQSFVIGDKSADIDFAHNVGAKGILVQTEPGKKISANTLRFRRGNQVPVSSAFKKEGYLTRPDYIANNLIEAVGWIGDALGLSKS